ncbi:AAA domain-containing protein [Pseudonocardia sediminis]|uniref:AAA domain-containing protein n=1 Tax=Pseudonocardia sediminis TaxID=1397368 RepID=A0A4Q7UTN1_PSEST|nr:AAA family ATPase [Pseudonocardia sediminis]RZT83339.1 AAA domain-containing protein [Pseudonocardia sediminis]
MIDDVGDAAAPADGPGGMLVVVTGPPGAGKSTVATTVHDRLGDAGIANALIEVDELERCYPPRDEDDVMADLAAMAGRYRAGGHDLLFVTATVEDDAYAERLVAAAGTASTVVVRLEADPGTLARRIREREPVGWSGTEDLVTHARCLAVGMADLARVDLVLSTDDTAVDDLAARIEELLRSRHR